jgi:hypothetical protein
MTTREDLTPLIDIVMRETTDEITQSDQSGYVFSRKTPNVLVEGCRAVGYVDPEEAARHFAEEVARALLARSAQP